MNIIVFVLGGARSGKSRFAESLALGINRSCKAGIAYIATGMEIDDEFRERIRVHRDARTEDFVTYEESIDIADKLFDVYEKHRVFVLECLTTWLGNLFVRMESSSIEAFMIKNIDRINSIFDNERSGEIRNEKALIRPQEGIRKYKQGKLFDPENKTLIVVSNEIGLGIVPSDGMSRLYRDIHGRMNMKMANYAEFVYFMTSGIPVRLS
jgi:adenosylcobinamide kinase/adenosylcobinamide-phosphate guanylyltransferase